jgi:hypothetical protein
MEKNLREIESRRRTDGKFGVFSRTLITDIYRYTIRAG